MMLRLRTAFNPDSRCSPAKMLPTGGGVHRAEQGRPPGGTVTGQEIYGQRNRTRSTR